LLIYNHGYTALAVLLVLVSALALQRLRHNPMEGAELTWKQGVWTLHHHGEQRVILIGPRSAALPWVIYLAVTDLSSGSSGSIWLPADSVSREQRRLLRVRLTLQH
jgi:hypothetical protein